MTRRAWLLFSLVEVGCIVPDVDLAGRPCPCLSGYACDSATLKCVATVMGDGGVDGGLGLPFFEDTFNGDLSAWTLSEPSWMIGAGGLYQPGNNNVPFMFVTRYTSLTDYHLVTRMTAQPGGVNGGAMELIYHVQAPRRYQCNWEPSTGRILIMHSDPPMAVADIVKGIDTSTFDPTAPVTMEVDVKADQVLCWLDEIPAARIGFGPIIFSSGSFGFQTYLQPAVYQFIRAYAQTTQ